MVLLLTSSLTVECFVNVMPGDEAAIAAKDIPESLLKDAAFYTVELKNASSRWVQIIQVYSGSSKGL